MRYDEFKCYDWKPGAVEAAALLRMLGGQLVAGLRAAARYLCPSAGMRSFPTGSATERSVRAQVS